MNRLPLDIFPLPLPQGPPEGYGWDHREGSDLSDSVAFKTSLANRDSFAGKKTCLLCGDDTAPINCFIISQAEPETWADLHQRGWLPPWAKADVSHEPRNGIILCSTHHSNFDKYNFFIRFVPSTGRYVMINLSNKVALQPFHGKAIALDAGHHYAPFPSLFLIHEARVRGFWPFMSTPPHLPHTIPWQDWVTLGHFVDSSGTLQHDKQSTGPSASSAPQTGFSQTHSQHGASTGQGHSLALNDTTIDEILRATRAMPSWKASQVEGMSWDGNAEENTKKYMSIIGVDKSI